ncbi:MAG: hypothetical protein ABI426_12040 [Flavobacterium sp.]
MKNTIIALITLISINCFSQKLVEFQIDKNVKITIPSNYKIEDTLLQKVIYVGISNGSIAITKSQNKDTLTTVEDEDDLIQYYAEFQKGTLEASKGTLRKQEIITKQDLKIKRIYYDTRINNAPYSVDNYVLFLENYTYAIQFIEPRAKIIDKDFKNQKEKILSSLSFQKNLTLQDQFNYHVEGSPGYKAGQISVDILVFLIIGFVIWLSTRRSKK